MSGNLAEGVLPGLLRELYVGRRNGFLRFSRAGEEVSVLLFDGRMVRAESNVKALHLGEVLASQKLLTEVDLAQATEVVVREKTRLGKALVDLGILTREQLEEGMAVHLRELLLRVFSWNDGTYAFEEAPRPDPKECDLTSKLSTGEMILEAVKRVEDPDIIRYALGDLDRVVGLSSDPLLRFQNIGLTPSDGYVLSRIDGTTSIRELIQLMPNEPDDVLRSLFALLSAGILEFPPVPKKVPPPPPKMAPAPAPPPPVPKPPTPEELALKARREEVLAAFESLKTKNHFEVLGIPKASTEAAVKEAYFKQAKAYHPDSQRDPGIADLRDKMEAVFIRLGEAYEVLKNPKSRGAYESDLAARAPRTFPQAGGGAAPAPQAGAAPSRQDPEAMVRNAGILIGKEQYWDAIQILEPAVPLSEGRLRQKVRVLLAKCYLKNPKWVHRAEEVLQVAVKEDGGYAEPFYLLGTIYKGNKLNSRALSMFRKAVELKPEHEEAKKELSELEAALVVEAPPPEETPGFLKKIFGRS
jgi:hypothetical protein